MKRLLLADDEVTVTYKFRGEKKVYKNKMTREQYENLKKIPIMEFCEITS